MKKFFNFLGKYKIHIFISLILIILVSLVSSYQPIVESEIINIIQDALDKGLSFNDFKFDILKIIFILIGMYVFVASSRLIYNILITTSIQNTMKTIREEVQQKIHKMPISYFDKHPIGDIMSRMSNDVESFGNGLQQAFAAITSSILTVIFILFFIFTKLTWQFALLAVLMFTIIFFVSRLILKYSGPLYQQRFKTFGVLSGHLQEQYTGYKEISLYNKQKDSRDMFDGIMVDLSDKIFTSDLD